MTTPLRAYINAIGTMFDDIEYIVRDSETGVGWSSIVDLDRTPNYALDWLAQFVGVTLPAGLTTPDKRERIRHADGWKRGTPASIKAIPLPYLTGNKTVLLTERDGSPYRFTIATLKTETPDADWGVNNILSNPSFETDTTGWTAVSSALTRETAQHWHGIASGKIITSNATANEGARIDFDPTRSGKHTVSAYAKGTGTVRLRVTDDVGATITAGTAVVLTSEWQRLTLTTDVNLLLGSTYRLYVETTVQAASTYYFDAAQVESTKSVSPFYPGLRPTGQGPVGTALRAQKPGGLIMTYIVIDGQTYRQLRDNHTDYQDVKDSYGTYEEARDDIPLV